MKLVRTVEDVSHYGLLEQEAELLNQLLQSFPYSPLKHVKVSNSQTPQTSEREALLNESLAAHRDELKRSARAICSRIGKTTSGHMLVLDAEMREMLMQILNDIRVGAWRAVGEPEEMDQVPENAPLAEQMQWHLMQLAGYFEASLIEASH